MPAKPAEQFCWTALKISRLRVLIASGMMPAEAARELRTTRNSIIGKCRRLGIKILSPPPANLQPGFQATVPARPSGSMALPAGHPTTWGAISNQRWPL